jgi:hypothetical protein
MEGRTGYCETQNKLLHVLDWYVAPIIWWITLEIPIITCTTRRRKRKLSSKIYDCIDDMITFIH